MTHYIMNQALKMKSGERNYLYNHIVKYDTYNHLILKNGFDNHLLFDSFKPIIHEHLQKNKDNIIKKLNHLIKKYPKSIKLFHLVFIILR